MRLRVVRVGAGVFFQHFDGFVAFVLGKQRHGKRDGAHAVAVFVGGAQVFYGFARFAD